MPIIVAALTQGQVLFLQNYILCSEAWIIGAFFQQTGRPNTNLAALICTLFHQRYWPDTLIWPIAFALLWPKYKCKLQDSCFFYLFDGNMRL